MTKLILGGVLLASAVASAEPPSAELRYAGYSSPSGMFIDFGFGAERVAPGDGNTYSANFVRFAPQATINRHFYIGAEMDIGSITGVKTDDAAQSARTSDPGGGVMAGSGANADGDIAAGKVLLGARAMAGIFSGAIELAPTYRFTTLSMPALGGSRSFDQFAVEAHGRLDLWLTPHFTVGGFIGADLGDATNLQAAVQVGWHFEAFDHSR
ncbi:MAG TPA: hypothetical protein VGC41_11720 [Kofleriaceae bacterium]